MGRGKIKQRLCVSFPWRNNSGELFEEKAQGPVTVIKVYTYLRSEGNLYLEVLEEYDNRSTANILNEAFPDIVV